MKFYLIFFWIFSTNVALIYSMQENNLIEYIRNNKLKEMVELIENGADPNQECGYVITDKPIVFAAYQDNLEAIKLLLENGTDINGQNDNGFTALIVAAKNKSIDMVQFLLSQNANASIKNKHGSDALFWAKDEIKSLLEKHNLLNFFIKKTKKTLKNGKKTSNIYDLITQRQIHY